MIKSMNSAELKTKMESGDNFILIDCREQDEWDAGRIEQAKFIPLSSFEKDHKEHLTNKDQEIIIQCRSGKRSMNACMFLLQNGYTNLTNLEGGILGWQNNGFDIKVD